MKWTEIELKIVKKKDFRERLSLYSKINVGSKVEIINSLHDHQCNLMIFVFLSFFFIYT